MALKIQKKSQNITLDIGTGAGLLSLMIAQKSRAVIHSIDIDKNAFHQAMENFENTSWSHRLHLFNEDVKTWRAPVKYDCIISNPPFYENDLLPNENGKKNSKHSNSLRLSELVVIVSDLLKSDGFFGVLLPYSRARYFEKEAYKSDLFTNEKFLIRQSKTHDYFRTIMVLEKNPKPLQQFELSIKNVNNEYSDEFVELLKDYYLYL